MALKKPEIGVTILGSGTCVPSLERSSCSVLLEIGNKKLQKTMGRIGHTLGADTKNSTAGVFQDKAVRIDKGA